jgi:RHH-type proline utilization regulon transcriptional repressor/proline dehydrogenase/delta 1-pyrroline-5-carboxylate dehydrogenase
MIFDYPPSARSELRAAISAAYRVDETEFLSALLDAAALPDDLQRRISLRARRLVNEVRNLTQKGGIEDFLREYSLSSHEGIALMCLAESLLRVPDTKTEEDLIEDKLASTNFSQHLGHSDSLFVNASSWAFMLTGKLLGAKESSSHNLAAVLTRLVARSTEPLIREALIQSMRIIGQQFIFAATIEAGLKRARNLEKKGYRFSFDMLGEAAITKIEAERFYNRYEKAISVIGHLNTGRPYEGPEISLKLSALDPRYEFAQYSHTLDVLVPRLKTLALMAKRANIGLTMDAEETDRQELQLDLLEILATDSELSGWDGLGIAIQTYQKRAYPMIDWLAELAQRTGRRLMVRLVKGAYWDTEIKHCQVGGYEDYAVFTRKESTDVSFIACTKKLLANTDVLYPMFATHNAYTVALILEMAGDYRDLEFQRLHGMGEALFSQITDADTISPPCRIYAPCGGHKELLPYLVRRLLENGANTSFVNRIVDRSIPLERIIANPIAKVRRHAHKPHPRIPLPKDLFGTSRQNSRGLDLTNETQLRSLAVEMQTFADQGWYATPIINGERVEGEKTPVFDPSDRRRQIGEVTLSTEAHIDKALSKAAETAGRWNESSVDERARCLERTADLLETHRPELIVLCVREAGKTLNNAIAEVREAVDFCRYYAHRARRDLAEPQVLPGNGGKVRYQASGVFACISPWNFPLAIFSGQIAAALVTGNTVVAKPAEQSPLIAAKAIRLFHEAGVPQGALHLLTGDGGVGAHLVSDPRITGVAFTGGTEAAHAIRRRLADGKRCVAPLIAETGGQNAMIVDSTALLEQAVKDILASAFDSAGQRCSALRVLFVQEDIAERMLELLAGAMATLRVGDPALLNTDVGPMIDREAKQRLEVHDAQLAESGRLIHACELTAETVHGTFFAPKAYEIDALNRLHEEHFGPILHVIRYAAGDLDNVLQAIHDSGYGLTFGLHSRIDSTLNAIRQRLRVGNVYVNRNIIGAVVGVQPFGGEGLSGTGPKAGGPHYLYRFTSSKRTAVRKAGANKTPASAPPATPMVSDNRWTSAPVIGSEVVTGPMVSVNAQGDADRTVGTVTLATAEHAKRAMALAAEARFQLDQISATQRADYLEQAASRLLQDAENLKRLCQDEAGIPAEHGRQHIAHATALCRAYAEQTLKVFNAPLTLPGPTGELNTYSLHNRGVFLCIGGAQQPVLSLVGMSAAALAAGNAVIVLPTAKALLIGGRLFSYFKNAGFPDEAMHFLPTQSDAILSFLIKDRRLAGVAQLGDSPSAYWLDKQIAAREGPLIPLVASIDDQADGGLFADPQNLYRFATERTLSINTAAAGGNASLYSME